MVSKRGFRQTAALTLALFIGLALSTPTAYAEGAVRTFRTARFTLHIGATRTANSPTVNAEQLATHSIDVLNETYDELTRIFESKPNKKVVLRFLSPEDFREQTGAPSWTSAMYFRDEISIPLPPQGPVNLSELKRALRHEYVHAFIAEISKHRCPAWLDEGVAQLIEGQPNPLLGPALRRWSAEQEAMPLEWLHNGFTTLDSEIVPAAYAQSLFATRSLVNSLGFDAIRTYLRLLGKGKGESVAFLRAFGQTKAKFEKQLTQQMRRWARSDRRHP